MFMFQPYTSMQSPYVFCVLFLCEFLEFTTQGSGEKVYLRLAQVTLGFLRFVILTHRKPGNRALLPRSLTTKFN